LWEHKFEEKIVENPKTKEPHNVITESPQIFIASSFLSSWVAMGTGGCCLLKVGRFFHYASEWCGQLLGKWGLLYMEELIGIGQVNDSVALIIFVLNWISAEAHLSKYVIKQLIALMQVKVNVYQLRLSLESLHEVW
jgi:hypothetical protein